MWTLQQFKTFLNDFLSLVLHCKEASPKKGAGKISKHFSTVNFTGDSVKALSITFLKEESIKPDGLPFLKKILLRNLSSSLSFVQSEQIRKHLYTKNFQNVCRNFQVERDGKLSC